MTSAGLWRALEQARKQVWGGHILPWSQLKDQDVRRVYTLAAKLLSKR